MSDFTETLIRNAALCDLARAIYRARALVFGGPTDLTEEPPSVRQDYITRADELLKTLTPKSDELFQSFASLTRAHFATGLRTPGSNVVGMIHPQGD